MYFTSGSDKVFERLMQGKPGFDHYDSYGAITLEDCGPAAFIARTGNINSASMQNVVTSRAS